MNLIPAFWIIALIVIPSVAVYILFKLAATPPRHISESKRCEQVVSNALQSLDMKSYVVFNNIVLYSDGNTRHTEIDHIVVSPYGIFCIETKSHHGTIYGYSKRGKWKQYLPGNEFNFFNPIHQNYKHVKALESLIGKKLKAPVHSYVVFPNAKSVKIDGEYANVSIKETIRQIEKHKTPVYNLDDCKYILILLAHASSKREEMSSLHKQEVQAFLRANAVRGI